MQMLSFLIYRAERIPTSSGSVNKRAHGFKEAFSACFSGFVKQVEHLPPETRYAIGGPYALICSVIRSSAGLSQ